jgi:magnesium transporter
VSFVLANGTLVTVRYHAPHAFEAFTNRALKTNTGCGDAMSVLAQLLDAVVDRIADVLEIVGQDVDAISKDIFRQADQSVRHHDFRAILRRIARKGDLISIIRDSLATLDRLFSFLGNLAGQKAVDKDTRVQVKTLSRDARSLSDHAGFLSQKITFLLDATLGMINIEQSGIIKIFSVAAVIFLPPTLVASIYGMNFEVMPELGWTFGYPFALLLMAVSAVIPYLFFKRKGWL